MKKIELLNIGDEILRGEIRDKNSVFIAKTLLKWGLNLHQISFLPDEEGRIVEEIREAIKRSEVVVLCGGLGPTPDDFTRRAISKALDLPLEVDPKVRKEVRKRMKKFNAPQELVEEQSKLPRGAQAIFSKEGSAPGFILERKGKLFFALPGVPSEMKEILLKSYSKLRQYLKSGGESFLFELRVSGLCEAEIMKRISGKVDLKKVAFYPGAEEVRLVIKGETEREGDEIKKEIKKILGDFAYEKSLPQEVGKLLLKKKLTLSLAESSTGGWIGKAITQVPGSSKYFLGGVVAYSNEAKINLLKIPREIIETQGAVSAECALYMAQGVRNLFQSSVSLSVTGIAGPTGGTLEKPVGLTYIGLSSPHGELVERYVFTGERSEIRKRAMRKSLNLLRLFLLRNYQ